ncbi:MAG: acetyl-CoA C-acetyltransferase [Deltaproteobacteria bacterium]|nr:acetyl-CoA C-acetyltransferase [Deltaproteobacteria bacterium]
MSTANPASVVLLGAARTPIGSFGGSLASVPAPKLGAVAIAAALQRSGVPADQVDDVYMGCVLPANQGQAPARQAALFAGLPRSTPCTTVNKVCGSGIKTVMLAASQIRAGDADVVIAGGMENMSQAPYYLGGARDGYRLGHGQVTDGMIKDGLWDVYNDFHMGNAAEICARDKGISREAQDAFAAESYRRAQQAVAAGIFRDEIAPVTIAGKKGDSTVVDADEEPGKGNPAKFAGLRPAFDKAGTITAANASSINDGAAAVVLATAAKAEALGCKPLARILGYASHAQDPEWFTTAPVAAVQKALAKAGLTIADIDLFEINEAFSVVSLACNQGLGVDPAKVNVHGGAVALGHPIGGSGTRILVTLLYNLQRQAKRYGVASLCIGGGEAVALVVERL